MGQGRDEYVLHIWFCENPECEDYLKEEYAVGPESYQEVGEPVCSACDSDLRYSHTLVKKGSA